MNCNDAQVAQLNGTIMDGGPRIEDSEIGDLTSSLKGQLQQLESIVMDAKLTIKRAEIELSLIKWFTIFVSRSRSIMAWFWLFICVCADYASKEVHELGQYIAN